MKPDQTTQHYTKLILHRKNLSSQSLKEGMLGKMRSYAIGDEAYSQNHKSKKKQLFLIEVRANHKKTMA